MLNAILKISKTPIPIKCRLIAHYLFAAAILGFYGGQV